MIRKIEVKNKSISELVDEDGVINAVKKITCNHRNSYIDEKAVIGKGTEIGYFCFINSCKIGDNVKIYGYCNLYNCEIGNGTQIASHVEIQSNVRIGSNCKIGARTFIPEGTIIGDNVFIGPGTIFCNDKNPVACNPDGTLKKFGEWQIKPVIVKNWVSIGAGACILPGLILEDYSIIGAGSVLSYPTQPNEIWYGNPARPKVINEVWRDIVGYEGLYEISNYGRVKSLLKNENGLIRVAATSYEGYHRLSLSKNGVKSYYNVHRLVAGAFIPNANNKPVVNHKNGAKWDNRDTNLEWVTVAENCQHAHETGLSFVPSGKDCFNYGKTGKRNGMSKPVLQIDTKTGQIINRFESANLASKATNISSSVISWGARKSKDGGYGKGYIWKYDVQGPTPETHQKEENSYLNMKNKNEPLKTKIVDGELVISVGVDTLVKALENDSPWLGYQIVNTENFVKSLIQEITTDHDGQSWITTMFTSAAGKLKVTKLDIKDEKDQWWALKLNSDKEVSAMVTKID